MDWLTFTVEMAKAVAWPVAAAVIASVFRAEIRLLLGRVKKGKLGPAEFEFEERVQELRQEAQSRADGPATKAHSQEDGAAKATDARSIVLESWLTVEAMVERLGKRHSVYNENLPTDLSYVVRELRKQGVLEIGQEQLYKDLRTLRNRAAHSLDFSPTADSVLTYVRLAQDLELQLRKAAGEA
jgi:hypothetical protein